MIPPRPPRRPDDALERRFPLGDDTAETEAVVMCPYCGEEVVVAVDPGGGSVQRYVQDCEVCCRPWRVTAAWNEAGEVTVAVRTEDE